MYTPPEIPDGTTSPEAFCESVRGVLQYWLDIHTNNEAWAQNWIIDDDAQYTLKEWKPDVNNYFNFDLKAAVADRQARSMAHLFYKCGNCGAINEKGFDCDNEDECADADPEDASEDEVAAWFEDIGADGAQVPDNIVIAALENEAFAAYTEQVEPVFRSVADEVREVLQAIDNADNNADLLQACMWGTRVFHVHGNIMSDYADRLGADTDTFTGIRDNGLESVFDSEVIRDFLALDAIGA